MGLFLFGKKQKQQPTPKNQTVLKPDNRQKGQNLAGYKDGQNQKIHQVKTQQQTSKVVAQTQSKINPAQISQNINQFKKMTK